MKFPRKKRKGHKQRIKEKIKEKKRLNIFEWMDEIIRLNTKPKSK